VCGHKVSREKSLITIHKHANGTFMSDWWGKRNWCKFNSSL